MFVFRLRGTRKNRETARRSAKWHMTDGTEGAGSPEVEASRKRLIGLTGS